MAKGWRISFSENGQKRLFLVGIADQKIAIEKVTGNRSGVSDVGVEPMSDDEVGKLALSDGRIIESSEMR